ncbi:MAG: sugar phosphate isomerase/epimerase family protein [Nitriliruptorales bacterium]
MGGLQILASTGPLFARPLDWAMGAIAEAGYDGVEVMVTQDPATQRGSRVEVAALREGVRIPVIHGPFLLLTRRVFGTNFIEKSRRSVALASEVGANLVIVHPPYRWQSRFHDWLTEEAGGEADALSTRIGLENLFPVSVLGRPVRFHRYTHPEHLAEISNLVLDTSHFGVSGVDIVAAWDRLGGKAAHLHVSDNRGQGHDSHAPLGHGILPLASFLAAVGRSSYTGAITLELDCRRYLGDRSALVGYLRQEREKCLALLGGAPAEEVLGRSDRATVASDVSDDDGMLPLDAR